MQSKVISKTFHVIFTFTLIFLCVPQEILAGAQNYSPRGVGGGGAFAGYAISPYAHLQFVGTDMGTLFRSADDGRTWNAVSQKETGFGSDLSKSSPVGFSANPKIIFFSEAEKKPKRSSDGGIHWSPMLLSIGAEEVVRYWLGDTQNPSISYCGTTQGLWRSHDAGVSWDRVDAIDGEARGTFIAGDLVFHANQNSVFLSKDHGIHFTEWFSPPNTGIRSFAGGASDSHLTLALIDTDGTHACAWARGMTNSEQEDSVAQKDCGYVWIKTSAVTDLSPRFSKTDKDAGKYVRMAENDSKVIYITGGDWPRQYGSKVWVSSDGGKTWSLKFQILNWDTHPYSPWPKEKLEYSAVGLDVGWNDNAYTSFAVNQTDSARAGGTGFYFLHTTDNFGNTWKAPFTQFADTGPKIAGKKWRSVGLEVTSVQRLKFHPKFHKLGYAAIADIGGLVTEDGGDTWRIVRSSYNTFYDFAFDPEKDVNVYAAAGSPHDFPLGNNEILSNTEGGIFTSLNRGRTWERLTPKNGEWNTEFLSVAFDPIHKILYGGTRGRGIARSTDGGKTWIFFNEGLPESGKIIPQMEIDPVNGNVYALLSGDPPSFSNETQTGIYFLNSWHHDAHWQLLRGHIHAPQNVAKDFRPWWFPTAFAVDFSVKKRNVLWLADMESKGAWLASGLWKSDDSGKNWKRVQQFTHPTAITLDPRNSKHVFASGLYAVDGSWGQGGALYSLDGGLTWKKNNDLPLLSNLDGTVLDPNQPGKLFYLFFGGGLLHGPEPK